MTRRWTYRIQPSVGDRSCLVEDIRDVPDGADGARVADMAGESRMPMVEEVSGERKGLPPPGTEPQDDEPGTWFG